ncbi:MAG: MerR family transcriptional regulator [Chloroflexi bacterium]|nr:MerR family transcriptional regulator [Chloroflexota bacterium]
MYKIGDFSQLGQVSVRMLRHYDKLGLLKPGQVDQWTSYRYYTLDQLPRLHRIIALKDLGLSLEQIGILLKDPQSDALLQEMLRERQRTIAQQLAEEQARLARVSARLQQIEHLHDPIPYEVVLKELPPLYVIAVREVVPHVAQMGEVRDRLLRSLYRTLADYHIEAGIELAVYHLPAYSETDIEMSLAVEVAHGIHLPPTETTLKAYHLPGAPLAASIVYHGSMWNIPDVVVNLYRWLGMNGYASAGAYREIHLFGRELDLFASDRPEDAVFEILVPAEPFV